MAATEPNSAPSPEREHHAGASPALPRDLAHEVDTVVDHLNADHGDAVTFLARHATGQGAARSATIDRIGSDHVRVTLELSDDAVAADLALRPFHDVAGLREQLLAMLGSARRAQPDVPLTTIERELADYASLPTLPARVVAAEHLSPVVRRIVVRGDLADLRATGGDAWVSLLVPASGRDQLPPDVTIQRLDDHDPDVRPRIAAYTVRHLRHVDEAPDATPDATAGAGATTGTADLELWVVLHEHGGGVADWARTARPGDPVAVAGCRNSWEADADHDHVLAVGDETALPAILGVVAQRAEHTTAQVLVETADADHVIDLDVGDDVPVTWAFRGGDPPGTAAHLLQAIGDLELPDGRVAVFGAAEAAVVRALRTHLRDERGLDRRDVRLTGYWRRDGPR